MSPGLRPCLPNWYSSVCCCDLLAVNPWFDKASSTERKLLSTRMGRSAPWMSHAVVGNQELVPQPVCQLTKLESTSRSPSSSGWMERDIDFSCSLSNVAGTRDPSKSRYLAEDGGFLLLGE